MNCTIEIKQTSAAGKLRNRRGFGSFFRNASWVIVGATILIVLLFYSLGELTLSRTIQHILTIFIYSASIALLSMLVVTWVSVRYTARFPRAIVPIQALCLVATACAGAFLAELVLCAVGLTPRAAFWAQFKGSLSFSIIITLVIGLSIATYETLQHRLHAAEIELRTRQVEQERAYKLLAEARLSSLESSIHPHFLFNTLNSIAALIPTNPQHAEDMVGKLASLLRFSLNAQQGGLVPLVQELKIVRDYLEIECTRFGPRLRYEILIPESLGTLKVPPLSLETLIENSVKHVAAQRTEGATIQIAGAIEAGMVKLEVIDDGPGFSLDATAPEHGLGNLAARLELLFGKAGRLDVAREENKTIVRISFPAES
jgi:two-component system, LytTR family, sensor histidine kinase AlgZ